MGQYKLPYGGLPAIIDLFKKLDPTTAERILLQISQMDENLYNLIKSNLIQFEDLIFLTPKMFPVFMKEIKITDLAKSLRRASPELKKHILTNVSQSMRDEILEILDGPKLKLSDVVNSEGNIMQTVYKLVKEEKIILKDQSSEYV